jgi:DNA-binding MarR family transcriptional regulator
MSDDEGETEEQIGAAVDAFRRILRELRIVARKTELATGLTAAQLFVLTAVAATPGCSVNDIAAATMTDRSSVAAVIDRLVESGYLTREPSDEDRRRASIAITASGRRAMRRTPPAPTALLIAALRKVPSKELVGLSAGLTALTRAMGIAHEPAGMLFEESPRGKLSGVKQTGSVSRGRRGG